MKKIYFITLLILVSTSLSIAQNKITGHETWMEDESGIMVPVRKTAFEYDENGNEVKITNAQWDGDQKFFKAINQEISTYNTLSQITSSFYESLRDQYNFYREETFVYEGDCLRSSIKKDYGETWIEQDITYYNPVNCLIDSIEKFEDYMGELKKYYVERYFYDGNEELRVLFGRDSLGGFTKELHYNEITRNHLGLITRFYSSFSDIGPEMRLKEYDENGHITYQAYYISNIFGGLELILEWSYDYTFNEEGQILKREITQTDHDYSLPPYINSTLTTETYAYFCDGLLDKKTIPDSYGTIVKYYQYQNGHDCELSTDADLLTIRPTLTDGQIFIESEILQAAESFISVYDMSGRRLIHIKTNRTQHYFVQLHDLPMGTYIVRVYNDSYNAVEKVVKK